MPRNSSGVYSLPAGNPVVTNTTISSVWANTTLDDIATAMTDSLSRSGDGGMLDQFFAIAGTVGAPGISWSLETTSGLYRNASNDFRFSVAGVDATQWGTNLFGLRGTAPALRWTETDAAADNGIWNAVASGENLVFNALTDALVATPWLTVQRTGGTIDSVAFAATAFGFGGAIVITSTAPRLEWLESDAAANNQRWDAIVSAEQLALRVLSDAGVAASYLTVDRTANTIDTIAVAATALNLTGVVTIVGNTVLLSDTAELRFGAGGDDLAIYHNGTGNFIDSNTGSLSLRGSPGNSYLEIESQSAGLVTLYGTGPSFRTYETDAGSNEKCWAMGGDASGVFTLRTRADDLSVGNNALTISRTGTTVNTLRILAALRVDSLDTNGALQSGVYTPTATNVANLGTVTPAEAQWLRVGNTVFVAGQTAVDPTSSATLTRFRLSLPISSNLGAASDLSGVGTDDVLAAAGVTPMYQIFGDATNDEAEFRCEAIGNTTSRIVRYTFAYQLI